MTLFDLVAKLTMDSSGFNKGVKDAENAGHNLSEKMSNMFNKVEGIAKAFVTGAVIKKVTDVVRGIVNDTHEMGEKIDKQSQVLGMSRKAYQEWDYILSQNGASIESMGTAMKTLNSLILSGIDGSNESADALAELGIHLAEIGNLSQEDQFEDVVRAFQKMPAGAQKSALAVKIFGKQGMQLLPLLNSSATSIDELRAKAQELGLIMSDDAIDAAADYDDALDTLQRTFNGFKYSIGSKILPVLTTGMEKITNFAGKLRKAYEEKGLAGVWDTLVESFKSIKWPTWDQVKEAIQTGWNTIKQGISGLAKLVFGENVDGSIHWPTWEEVGKAIGTAWKAIVNGVKNLGTTIGKAVFGENVDGSIHWPTWDEVGQFIQTAWKGIVDGVKGLATGFGKVVFGENVDGTIKWPTWDDVKAAAELAWTGIKDGVKNIGKIMLDFGINLIGGWFNTIKGWLDGTGIKKVTINFGATVAKWIETISDWVKNGIKVVVNFFNGGVESATNDTGFFQGGEPSGPSWGEGLPQPEIPGWNAKGVWDVPYNDFLTKLHRNEMVLSASQARDYREGVGTGVDMTRMASMIADSVRSAIENATIRSYINGKDITDEVNRNNIQAVKARRYAT